MGEIPFARHFRIDRRPQIQEISGKHRDRDITWKPREGGAPYHTKVLGCRTHAHRPTIFCSRRTEVHTSRGYSTTLGDKSSVASKTEADDTIASVMCLLSMVICYTR